jgi:hypothetical protein
MSDPAATAQQRHAIDRRTLIRRAAVSGAIAWTAPVLVDSLASPAGAFTPRAGCTFLVFNSQCGENSNQTPCNTLGGCTPDPQLVGCLTAQCEASGAITVTANCGSNCSISAAQAKDGNDCVGPDTCGPTPGCSCADGTGLCSAGVQTVHWNPPSSGNYAQITIFLTCT